MVFREFASEAFGIIIEEYCWMGLFFVRIELVTVAGLTEEGTGAGAGGGFSLSGGMSIRYFACFLNPSTQFVSPFLVHRWHGRPSSQVK